MAYIRGSLYFNNSAAKDALKAYIEEKFDYEKLTVFDDNIYFECDWVRQNLLQDSLKSFTPYINKAILDATDYDDYDVVRFRYKNDKWEFFPGLVMFWSPVPFDVNDFDNFNENVWNARYEQQNVKGAWLN